MSVLGAVLWENEVISKVQEILSEGDFYSERNRVLWRVMVELRRRQEGIDARTVIAALRSKNTQLEDIGGELAVAAFIAQIVAETPTSANAPHYARIVHETAYKRRVAETGTALATLAHNGVTAEALSGEVARILVATTLEQVESAEAPPKVLALRELYQVVDEWDRQPWVWDGILPHASLSLIVGKSETGKSTLIYGLIYSIIKGMEFFGRSCQQGPVLYLAGDPISEIVAGKTFQTMGLVPGIDPVHVVPGALVSQPSGMQMLRAWVKELKPILIVADTLAATVRIDTDKYGQSYEAQQPLSAIARRSSANFLMSHHSQKSAIDSYGVIDAALGSVGIAAVASTRMATKMYRRAGKKFFTFEMSNLRLGTPIEGECLVDKADDGTLSLGGRWGEACREMDRQLIMEVLIRAGMDEGVSERTLWNEIFPKPKWQAFKPALEGMVADGVVTKRKRGKKGGGKEYLLTSQVSTKG